MAGLCAHTTKHFKGRQIHILVDSFHFKLGKYWCVGKVDGKSIGMQSSALAFASICGGDLTSMMYMYSKYIYYSLIENSPSVGTFSMVSRWLLCETLSNHNSFQNEFNNSNLVQFS